MSSGALVHADVIALMDDAGTEFADGALVWRDGVIVACGPADLAPQLMGGNDRCRGCVVTPGLVNTHHHLYQSLTRAVPDVRTPRCSAGSRRSIRSGRAIRPTMC
jgi:cytosine/adenosine deaminase-related metal-dependent hydrolase